MNRFTEKIGGLPVWAWSAIIGLALVAMMYWSKVRKTSSGTPVVAPVGTGALDALIGGGGTISSGKGTVGTPTGGEGSSDFMNNQTWLAQGLALLGGQGIAPLDAERALTNYLNGDALTGTQTGWLNRVISQKGLAPQGTAGLSDAIGDDGLTDIQRVEQQNMNVARLEEARRAQMELDAANAQTAYDRAQQGEAEGRRWLTFENAVRLYNNMQLQTANSLRSETDRRQVAFASGDNPDRGAWEGGGVWRANANDPTEPVPVGATEVRYTTLEADLTQALEAARRDLSSEWGVTVGAGEQLDARTVWARRA